MVGPTVVDTGKQIWATLISHHLQCCCLGSAHIFGICGHIESDIYIIILFIFNISKCHSILENDVVGAMAPTGPSWLPRSKQWWLTFLFIIFICYCIFGLVAASSYFDDSWFSYDAVPSLSLGFKQMMKRGPPLAQTTMTARSMHRS